MTPMLTIQVLVGFIVLLGGYLIYEQYATVYRHGNIALSVKLKRKYWIDGAIFVGLIGLVYFYAFTHQSDSWIQGLLIGIFVISGYLFLVRQPVVIFKKDGFFYSAFFIPYQRIHAMNLSEDGGLVLQLEQKQLVIWVKHPQDLEKIYQVLREL